MTRENGTVIDAEGQGDISLPVPEQNLPSVPPGDYLAAVTGARVTRAFRAHRLELAFEILEPGPHLGEKIFGYCNVPETGKKTGKSSKLWRWMAVALGRRPTSKDRSVRTIFLRKAFQVRVTLTKRKLPDSPNLLPELFNYSVVSEILSRYAGSSQ